MTDSATFTSSSFVGVWRRLPAERRKRAAIAFLRDSQRPEAIKSVLDAIRQQLNVRSEFLRKASIHNRAGYLALLSNVNEQLAGNLVRA